MLQYVTRVSTSWLCSYLIAYDGVLYRHICSLKGTVCIWKIILCSDGVFRDVDESWGCVNLNSRCHSVT